MSKTVGGNAKGLNCQNCGEAYGWSEYFDYMMSIKSTTVECYLCPAENYVVPRKTGGYLVFKVLSLILSAAIIASPFLMLNNIWNSGRAMNMGVAAAMIGGGLFFGTGAYYVIMKTFNWLTGSLTMDKAYKSASDYDHY